MRFGKILLQTRVRRETTFWIIVFIACVLMSVVAYVGKSFYDEATDESPMMYSPYEKRTTRTLQELEEQMLRTEEWEREVRAEKRREEERLRRQRE